MTQASDDRQMRAENTALLHTLSASIEHIRASQDKMQDKQDTQGTKISDIRERVIGIESQGHGALIAALVLRMNALETSNQRTAGATSLVETLIKSPLVIMMLAAGAFLWGLVTDRIKL